MSAMHKNNLLSKLKDLSPATKMLATGAATTNSMVEPHQKPHL